MEEFITGILREQGLAGLVIFGLGWAANSLFNLYSGVQEKRIVEAKSTAKALIDNTTALEQLSNLIRGWRNNP